MRTEDLDTLVNYRLEQAQTALDDAAYLLAGQRSPQSIINRSYYAMFYAGLALLQRRGTVPSKHTGVISLFDTEFVLKGLFPKELSKQFHKAFELRQTSDYKATEPSTQAQADTTLRQAMHFVESVRAYLQQSAADAG